MKKMITTILLIIFSIGVYCQNELSEAFTSVDKVMAKTVENFPKEGRTSKNGGGYSASLKLLDSPPKKVALVSFFTFDPGLSKKYSVNYVDGSSKVTKTRGMTEGAAAVICDGFYYNSIESLVDLFSKNGMKLMLPDEFLNTPEKKNYYNNFEVKHDKFDGSVNS